MEPKATFFQSIWRTKPMQVIQAEEKAEDIPRTLTLFDLVCIGIGGTIGSGIFSTAGSIISSTAGPAAVISWLIAASGRRGVARSWGDKVEEWLILDYPDKDFHWLNLKYANILGGFVQFMSMVVLLLGVRFGKAFVNTITMIKVCVVIFIIVVGFAAMDADNFSPFIPKESEVDGATAFGFQGIITGASQAFFGYVGFDEVCCLAGETKNPEKIMPIAVMSVVIGTTVLSTLCSLVLSGMVPYVDASSFPAGFEGHGWKWAGVIVRAGETCTMPVVALIGFLAQPRLNYAVACDGLMPKIFTKVDDSGNLWWNTLITGLFFTVVAVVVPFITLWDIVTFGVMMSFNVANIAILMVRMKDSSPQLAPRLVGALFVVTGCAAFFYQEGYVNQDSSACLVLAIIFLALTVGVTIWLAIRCPQSLNDPLYFSSPLIPYIPAVCMLANWFMIAQINHLALGLSVAWVAVAILSYFAYGFWYAAGRSGWGELLRFHLPSHGLGSSLQEPMLSVHNNSVTAGGKPILKA
ncbi:hypothetical protein Gpo141_00013073 [Globisporangium polare]